MKSFEEVSEWVSFEWDKPLAERFYNIGIEEGQKASEKRIKQLEYELLKEKANSAELIGESIQVEGKLRDELSKCRKRLHKYEQDV